MSNPAWGKWVQSVVGYNSVTKQPRSLEENETLWDNGLFTVHLKLLDRDKTGALWLSIRRNDRKAVRDWRHFQRIKNELAGAEREAIEIFPAESQLVDGANQYHLWVLPEGKTTPFTWQEGRQVFNDNDGFVGAVQRPYKEEMLA